MQNTYIHKKRTEKTKEEERKREECDKKRERKIKKLKKRKKRVAKPQGMYYNGKAVKKKAHEREVNRKKKWKK